MENFSLPLRVFKRATAAVALVDLIAHPFLNFISALGVAGYGDSIPHSNPVAIARPIPGYFQCA
jgi:hypothetical protein